MVKFEHKYKQKLYNTNQTVVINFKTSNINCIQIWQLMCDFYDFYVILVSMSLPFEGGGRDLIVSYEISSISFNRNCK